VRRHFHSTIEGDVRVLLAEDDVYLSAMLAKGLREHAYAVDVAPDGDAAVYQIAVNEYDLVILDVLMPGRDGFDVCREIRRRGLTMPVLMLTARDAVSDRIAGLDAGADDFSELLARMRALLRRAREVRPVEITIGDLVVDTRGQVARRAGRQISLTTKEYALLEYLAQNAGRVVGRADICAHVWDDNHDPFSNAIEVYIGRLRRKVDGEREPLIHTRRGAGYMLSAIAEEG
jgi:DNA-binding response OmpR family regulator